MYPIYRVYLLDTYTATGYGVMRYYYCPSKILIQTIGQYYDTSCPWTPYLILTKVSAKQRRVAHRSMTVY